MLAYFHLHMPLHKFGSTLKLIRQNMSLLCSTEPRRMPPLPTRMTHSLKIRWTLCRHVSKTPTRETMHWSAKFPSRLNSSSSPSCQCIASSSRDVPPSVRKLIRLRTCPPPVHTLRSKFCIPRPPSPRNSSPSSETRTPKCLVQCRRRQCILCKSACTVKFIR